MAQGYLIERVVNNDTVTNWRMNVKVFMNKVTAEKLVNRANSILDNLILDQGFAATEIAELSNLDPQAGNFDPQDLSYEISEIEVY